MNYFEILEVSENAETEVIKASYRALVKKYHSDNFSEGLKDADERMKIINEAYETLSDETKRKDYLVLLHTNDEKNIVEYVEKKSWCVAENEKVDDAELSKAGVVLSYIVVIALIIWGIYYGISEFGQEIIESIKGVLDTFR